MKVVTIVSDLENPFLNRLLIPSCAAVGFEMVVLHANKGFQLRDKRIILANYLAGGSVPDDELLLFADGYDTVFAQGESCVRAAYGELSASVVFGAELNCWPLAVVGLVLQDGPPGRPYPYLNSGAFIGPAGEILALLKKYPKPPSDQFKLLQHLRSHDYDTDEWFGFSDQYYWFLVQLLESEQIGLDHGGVLFENFGPAMGDMADATVMQGISEFFAHGKESASYRDERTRLDARLRSPTGAQLHFGGTLAKAVMLDLFTDGQLPGWLRALLEPVRNEREHVQVEQASY
jgi:hypothetical protein